MASLDESIEKKRELFLKYIRSKEMYSTRETSLLHIRMDALDLHEGALFVRAAIYASRVKGEKEDSRPIISNDESQHTHIWIFGRLKTSPGSEHYFGRSCSDWTEGMLESFILMSMRLYGVLARIKIPPWANPHTVMRKTKVELQEEERQKQEFDQKKRKIDNLINEEGSQKLIVEAEVMETDVLVYKY